MRFSALLALLVGCGRIGFDESSSSLNLVFTDDEQSEFDRGTYDDGDAPLAWRGGIVQLADAPFSTTRAGGFVSRAFDTGDPSTIWDTLAWIPSGPYGRPLPGGREIETGYADGGATMTGNTLLLHFDGTSIADGNAVLDASGAGHDGRMVFDGQGASYIAGEFGQALDIERDAYVTLNGDYFDYGTEDFTYAVWVKMFDCSLSNNNRIAMGGAGAADTPHIWIGAQCPEACPAGDSVAIFVLDSTGVGAPVAACTGTRLDDGAWHLLTGIKQGHAQSTLRLYVDGREVGTTAFAFGATSFNYDGGEIRLGSFNLFDPAYHTKVIVDEAAIWKRALSPREVEGLYRRGALRLLLQLRVCSDGACDTEPFIGPDGTSATSFTEGDLVGPPGSQRGNLTSLGLVGQLAQYRATFATATAAASPGLVSVTVEAKRP